jgi:hypothetical protein
MKEQMMAMQEAQREVMQLLRNPSKLMKALKE